MSSGLLRNRRVVLSGVIVCALLLFVSVTLLSQAHLKQVQVDLTADRLYTLSEGTRQILAEIDEPIELRFYRSAGLQQLGPFYANHARRVDELLERYVRLSEGRLRVVRIDPQRYSPEEDMATGDGITPVATGEGGAPLYLGIAGSNSTDDLQAIPVLSPVRDAFLEYDLTRMVYTLANPERPVVAVLGALPLRGDQRAGREPWQVLQQMESFFEVRFIRRDVERIDADVDALVLAQPEEVSEKTLYALDQFALRGGRVLAFADPLPEVSRPGMPPMEPGRIGRAPGVLAPLFAAWGIEVLEGAVVGDPEAAVRVRVSDGGGETSLDHLPWLELGEANLVREDVVTGPLSRLALQSAGHIRLLDDAPTVFEPLVTTGERAGLIDRDRMLTDPAPQWIEGVFEPLGERLVLAARLSGPVSSAFPDGPPDAVEDEDVRAAHLARSETPFVAIVMADADVLADATWVQSGTLFGRRVTVPVADNGEFVVGALNNLTGGEGLRGLRARPVTERPFEVIREMRREAERRFRDKEQELLERIGRMEERINELRRQEREAGVILSAEEQEAIDSFRREVIAMRAELRSVRHALDRDVNRLENRITLLNIAGVPALVILAALALAGWRRLRMRQG